jgi:hypothetical protein
MSSVAIELLDRLDILGRHHIRCQHGSAAWTILNQLNLGVRDRDAIVAFNRRIGLAFGAQPSHSGSQSPLREEWE